MGMKKGHKMTEAQVRARPKARVQRKKVELEFTATTSLTKAQWIAALLADKAAQETLAD